MAKPSALGRLVEASQRNDAPTGTADLFDVGITTGADDARPDMEQLVVRQVLTDHKIRPRIVRGIFVNVVYLGLRWKGPPERSLGYQ
jgi:hypothetical protein